jgi:nitrite reductase/ring-hydroxylating ferredoxin subunit
MALVKVKPLAEFSPGAVEEVTHGEAIYAVCNVDGVLHCLEGVCPHEGGPLGLGTLNGNFVVCPWQGWEFDCRTGLNDFDEDVKLATFPVVVRDGIVLIDVP